MEIAVIILLIVVVGLVGVVFFKLNGSDQNISKDHKTLLVEKIRLETDLKNSFEKISKLESELKKEAEEKHTFQGKNKMLMLNNNDLNTKNDVLQERQRELLKKITEYESSAEERKRDFEKSVEQVNETRKSLEDEKARIRREDEDKIQKENEERDKIWNEHENESISYMKTICQKPGLAFEFFENTSLPDTFDGGLKPDFLVKFLDQYIIFDAKMSKSNDLNIYIKGQVQSTAKKIKESKNSDEIYSTIFFVVPDIDFVKMKQFSFYEEGFSFYVIPKAGFEAVLAAYKKVSDYDLAESFDPKERENIVNIIAALDHHITKQNAFNLLSSVEGLKVSAKKEVLKKDLLEDIEIKKGKIRLENFKPTDLKRLIKNPEEQIKEIKGLVNPKDPEISEDSLEDAANTLL